MGYRILVGDTKKAAIERMDQERGLQVKENTTPSTVEGQDPQVDAAVVKMMDNAIARVKAELADVPDAALISINLTGNVAEVNGRKVVTEHFFVQTPTGG
jgi:hypothetical protein